jgi:thymidine kinase
MGYLTVIMGCMFAQKTTELLKRIRRYESIGYKVLVVNYKHDTRYGTGVISSHDIDQHPAHGLTCLADLPKQVNLADYQVLIIDEAQFFGDLHECVTVWTDTMHLHVVVCGLDGDAERKPFGDILRMIPYAEEVVRLNAYCADCRNGTLAHFSKRVVASAEQVLIGAADSYKPVCRAHFLATTQSTEEH